MLLPHTRSYLPPKFKTDAQNGRQVFQRKREPRSALCAENVAHTVAWKNYVAANQHLFTQAGTLRRRGVHFEGDAADQRDAAPEPAEVTEQQQPLSERQQRADESQQSLETGDFDGIFGDLAEPVVIPPPAAEVRLVKPKKQRVKVVRDAPKGELPPPQEITDDVRAGALYKAGDEVSQRIGSFSGIVEGLSAYQGGERFYNVLWHGESKPRSLASGA